MPADAMEMNPTRPKVAPEMLAFPPAEHDEQHDHRMMAHSPNEGMPMQRPRRLSTLHASEREADKDKMEMDEMA